MLLNDKIQLLNIIKCLKANYLFKKEIILFLSKQDKRLNTHEIIQNLLHEYANHDGWTCQYKIYNNEVHYINFIDGAPYESHYWRDI